MWQTIINGLLLTKETLPTTSSLIFVQTYIWGLKAGDIHIGSFSLIILSDVTLTFRINVGTLITIGMGILQKNNKCRHPN